MNVLAIADPEAESGVPHGRALLDFATAAASVAGRDDARLAEARQALRTAMGGSGVADAAAVTSNFERMVRIADATGIVLGDWMESCTEGVRADLGLDRLRRGENGNGSGGAPARPRAEGHSLFAAPSEKSGVSARIPAPSLGRRPFVNPARAPRRPVSGSAANKE